MGQFYPKTQLEPAGIIDQFALKRLHYTARFKLQPSVLTELAIQSGPDGYEPSWHRWPKNNSSDGLGFFRCAHSEETRNDHLRWSACQVLLVDGLE